MLTLRVEDQLATVSKYKLTNFFDKSLISNINVVRSISTSILLDFHCNVSKCNHIYMKH